MTTGDVFCVTRPGTDSTNAAASTAFVQAVVTAAIAAIVFPAPFPSGTGVVFYQASAPTGWTALALNDRALRVVTAGGTGGSGGGTNAFSTVFAQTTVGNTTLSTAQLASHTHSFTASLSNVQVFQPCGLTFVGTAVSAGTTGASGSGSAHNHTITMSILYSDVIICTKN